jgi:hypothetical protein
MRMLSFQEKFGRKSERRGASGSCVFKVSFEQNVKRGGAQIMITGVFWSGRVRMGAETARQILRLVFF